MLLTNLPEVIIERSMRAIAGFLAAGRLQTRASGIENLPELGPVLVVARHYHHLYDGLMLFAAIQRRFHVVVALDWVNNHRSKIFMAAINRVARWPTLLRGDALERPAPASRALFSRPDLLRYQRRALGEAVALLAEGRLLVVFPEGYPNIDPVYTPKSEPEQFLPFKPGFLSILSNAETRLGLKIPIIPAGLHYRPGEPWTGYLSFGKAIYRDQTVSRAELLQRLEAEVKKLSGLPDNAAIGVGEQTAPTHAHR